MLSQKTGIEWSSLLLSFLPPAPQLWNQHPIVPSALHLSAWPTLAVMET